MVAVAFLVVGVVLDFFFAVVGVVLRVVCVVVVGVVRRAPVNVVLVASFGPLPLWSNAAKATPPPSSTTAAASAAATARRGRPASSRPRGGRDPGGVLASAAAAAAAAGARRFGPVDGAGVSRGGFDRRLPTCVSPRSGTVVAYGSAEGCDAGAGRGARPATLGRARSSASPASWALAGRSAGCFSRSDDSTTPTASGRSGIGGGGSSRCARRTAIGCEASNGGRPDSIS